MFIHKICAGKIANGDLREKLAIEQNDEVGKLAQALNGTLVVSFVALGYLLVKLPLANAGDPNEPAAPAVM